MAKNETAGEGLYDLDNVPSTENSAPALIETAGILHNLKPAVALKEGEYKDKEKGKWHGFEIRLTNAEGLEFSEIYFMPPQKVEDVHENTKIKHYELVDGKLAETRLKTPAEALRVLNNEFLSFLIDIGESFGFKHKDVEEHLFKAVKSGKGFLGLCNAFIDKFKPAETTRVSAKLLWDNNDKGQKSYLKVHGIWPVYFPYGNDFFDVYRGDNAATVLKLSAWEVNNKLKRKYTNISDAPTGEETSGVNKQGGYKKILDVDDEPF
jgi:hypothetical protein